MSCARTLSALAARSSGHVMRTRGVWLPLGPAIGLDDAAAVGINSTSIAAPAGSCRGGAKQRVSV